MTATAPPPAPPRELAATTPQRQVGRGIVGHVIGLLGSMKLTVVILCLFGVLTFAGTLAQRDLDLYLVQRDFFESAAVVWNTQVGVPTWLQDLVGPTWRLWLPGGYSLMLLLFVNLLVGGVVRLRWSLRNSGILVAHLGIALLLVAGFVKLHYSFSGRLSLWEGEQGASMVSFHEFELALVQQRGNELVERTIPASAIAAATAHDDAQPARDLTIDDPTLPFTLVVSHWMENCDARPKGPMFEVAVPVVVDSSGPGVYLHELPVDPKERGRNSPGCYVTAVMRDGSGEHQGILVGVTFRATSSPRLPFTFTAAGTTWGLDLRHVTYDLPFTLRLDKFEKKDHPGTRMAADFSSWVTVLEGDRQLPVHIYMNHPLRRDGLVFYQTNWGPQPGDVLRGPPWYSVFEVASNPSDAWPKYASYVILLGLLGHFVAKLWRYLDSSGYRAARETA